MQAKLQLWVASATFAALAASGGALAQSSDVPNQPSDVQSTASGDNSSGDKSKQSGSSSAKSKSKSKAGAPNNPITVTPPSDQNPQTGVDVTTDPARAHGDAGPQGVNANANLNGTETDSQSGQSGTTDAKSKGDSKKQDLTGTPVKKYTDKDLTKKDKKDSNEQR
jgi:hypothetical protein